MALLVGRPGEDGVEPEGGGAVRGIPGNLELLRRYWAYARRDWRWLALSVVAVPLTSLAGLAQPYLVKETIDGPVQRALDPAHVEGSPLELSTIAALFLVALVAEYLFRSTQLYALQRMGYLSLQRLRGAVYRHLLGQGQAFFDRRAIGTLLSRATNDVESLGEVLTMGVVGIFGDVVSILAILAMMIFLHAKLTAVSLLAAPLIVLTVNFFRRRLRHYSAEVRRAMAESTGFFAEALAGHGVVQMHGRERPTVAEYKALNHRYLRAYHRSNWFDASLYAIMDGVAGLSIALLIWYGAGLHLRGSVSLGLLVAFIQYIQRLYIPVRELSGKVATIERAFAALERIFDLLSVDARVPSGDHRPARVRGEIAIEALTFRYAPGDPPAVVDLSLRLEAGEVVALVGPTGSGKSTVGKLLTRTYEAPHGRISLDGVPLERWDLAALRTAIGVVPQDVVLFSGSIARNIALGREDIDPRAIERAVDDARLGARIARLGGLDAEISERGANLSAGERQLLSIARVLARDPRVVILDEATAHIDSQTEQDVQRAIERVFEGRTVLVVAHRLSTIRRADRIAVLDRGRIVEQGTHDGLMARGGLYAHLVRTALRDPRRLPPRDPTTDDPTTDDPTTDDRAPQPGRGA